MGYQLDLSLISAHSLELRGVTGTLLAVRPIIQGPMTLSLGFFLHSTGLPGLYRASQYLVLGDRLRHGSSNISPV